MNVIDFPLRQSDHNFLTAAERQSIIAALYRVGITDYDQVVTVDGRTHSIGWTDRWDRLGGDELLGTW